MAAVVLIAECLHMVFAFVVMELRRMMGLVGLRFTQLTGSPALFYEEIPIWKF